MVYRAAKLSLKNKNEAVEVCPLPHFKVYLVRVHYRCTRNAEHVMEILCQLKLCVDLDTSDGKEQIVFDFRQAGPSEEYVVHLGSTRLLCERVDSSYSLMRVASCQCGQRLKR